MTNTQPARGMRDFLPADIRKRNYVIGIIKEVYEKYGFEPLETPSVENLETLTGKYGEEGSQLMFKILKRGEKLQQELAEGKIKSENELSDLALRYDLTVPLARVVANYKNDLPKFFKRYQIQPVWRADRPAKGRYREFYQCDVDAIGSTSMIVDAELCTAVAEILKKLGFEKFSILINHRELLRGVLEVCGIDESSHTVALVAIDKLDKIGKEGVLNELRSQDNFSEAAIVKLGDFIDASRPMSDVYNYSSDPIENEYIRRNAMNQALFDSLNSFLGNNETGKSALKKLHQTLELTKNSLAQEKMTFFPTLARGLSYYTGAIFEVGLDEEDFNLSVAGGGRYDGLIGMFGKEQIPAVGFSIGLERILYVMEERGMFPENLTANPADVMITLWNEDAVGESLKLAGELRAQGLRVLVYPEADKLGKQFKYADSLNIPYVCVLGETELAENKVSIKNLKTGEQENVSREEVFEKIKK